MGTIDLDESHLKDMTVDDLISTIVELNPALKLVDALRGAQDRIAILEDIISGKEKLISILVKERDAAMELAKRTK